MIRQIRIGLGRAMMGVLVGLGKSISVTVDVLFRCAIVYFVTIPLSREGQGDDIGTKLITEATLAEAGMMFMFCAVVIIFVTGLAKEDRPTQPNTKSTPRREQL